MFLFYASAAVVAVMSFWGSKNLVIRIQLLPPVLLQPLIIMHAKDAGSAPKPARLEPLRWSSADNAERKKKVPRINNEICIGCGVCSLKCSKTGALKLIKRKKRVILPETTYERIILQCLERGTLQHQIFGNPEKISQKMMKGILGGFLNLTPVKKALMSDILRSSFLDAMKKGTVKQNKEYLLKT